ncbi:hypothetical protein [Geomonas sp.]|uniref:hypothetical protein n=1 Tax=Geomonas sp. TaxID=2651584 RepID=UPI002B460BB1|nr:hypothetical protein [Geomonas sp.]HJV35999.1 hypothetical protein [Geomonas sp.]
MTRALERASTMIVPLLLLLLTAGKVAAAEGKLRDLPQHTDASAVEAPAAEVPSVETPSVETPSAETQAHPEEERHVEQLIQQGGYLGYNGVAVSGHGGNAEPYGFLRSSPGGGLFYRSLKQDSNLELEGNFLNEHDYHGDLLLDYKGDYRLHARTESLYHNLNRDILFSPNFQAGRTDAPTPALYQAIQDPPQDYGISVQQSSADFRYRLHNYPLHVNIGYWRLVREGNKQLRFADTAFEGTPNTVYALRQGLDQLTQECRIGMDAHLGPVDVIYDFKFRTFEDREATPLADYVPRNTVSGAPDFLGGIQQHNQNPDSRYYSHTVKLHTSLSGGLVGSGAYSIEQRENRSSLTDFSGTKHLKADLHNVAGDLVYTPSKEYSLAVKYRRQDLDNDYRSVMLNTSYANPALLVKTPINTSKDLITVIFSYRPRVDLSVNAEYKGEFQRRENNISSQPSQVSWALPETTDINKGILTVNYRPVTGVRFSGEYSYTNTDHPSYGSSFQQQHQGKLLGTYTRSNKWGGSANLIARREWNDDVEHFLVNFPLDPLTYSNYPLTSRERTVVNANGAVWWVPVTRLTVGANYAFLYNNVDQTVLFTSVAVGSQAASNFYDRSHVYGLTASFAATEQLDLSLMLQQVRSTSAFQPEFRLFSATSSTAGVEEITRLDTVISQLSAKGEYRFTKAISSSLEYVIKDYDEKNPSYSSNNGTVHTVWATVAAKW